METPSNVPSVPHGSVGAAAASSDPDALRGVAGWLKFFVIGNIYLAPIFLGLQYLLAWIGFIFMAKENPGIIILGLMTTAVDGVLVYMGIQAGRALRDVRARAVQQMKQLLKLRLGWVLIGTPLSFLGWSLAGLDPADLASGALKGVVVGVLGFTVGWLYFNRSKRVRNTYPDWHA